MALAALGVASSLLGVVVTRHRLAYAAQERLR